MASYLHNAPFNRPKPWPAYFVVRTSGEVVPLIGVDELPIGTDLVGIPRALELEETIGMINLGIQRSSNAFYKIVQCVEENAEITESASKPAGPEQDLKAKAFTPPSQFSARVFNATRSTSPPLHPIVRTNSTRALPETQTCRHWCTHGICKWGQQCRYRHIMPMTFPGLQEIGLSDWPQWYRALNPGYFARESASMKLNFRRPAKGRTCAGNGCCGGVSHAKAEGLRTAASPTIKAESGGGRKMDAGELKLARLRVLPKELVEKKVSETVLLKRAAAKDTSSWEEDGSEISENNQDRAIAKTSFLD